MTGGHSSGALQVHVYSEVNVEMDRAAKQLFAAALCSLAVHAVCSNGLLTSSSCV